MTFGWTRSRRTGLALALLVSVGVLLGLSAATHSHDGGFSTAHCEACRWSIDTAPALVVLLIFLLTLPECGSAQVPVPAFRTQTSHRRLHSRGPPLV
jgi:hypothetical protein